MLGYNVVSEACVQAPRLPYRAPWQNIDLPLNVFHSHTAGDESFSRLDPNFAKKVYNT